MKKIFFLLFFLLSNTYSANIITDIHPDSIYVGSIGILSIFVNNLKTDEVADFPIISSKDEVYTVKSRLLHNSSAEYAIQFWKSGIIKIPSLSININKNKNKIFQINSDEIEISIYSNIDNYDGKIRTIKPMQDIRIVGIFQKLFYFFLIIIGLIISLYLWNKGGVINVKKQYKTNYKKPIFIQTIEKINNLKIPKNIDRKSTEEFYISLSLICRLFINETYFIRATEMTSNELLEYFKSISVDPEIVVFWNNVNQNIDRAKYGGELPSINEFEGNKKKSTTIIKKLNIYKQ